MKKFKIEILIEDNGQDNGNFYDSETLKADIESSLRMLDLNIIEINIVSC